ncbi:MAG: hypothetical protein US86_C0007G0056 [Candidatus Daviesbacteria bacterium GW2011_GWA2_38_24]|uniref:Uncharacterized protein n=1 Tax=Candidatus Daviesbacteria bacterium GW2011_GWA2_38_24 TaxID=1618422 RepID=A0A0G0MM60_9BACT|nr:MAG: hypothetical protein US86_C0007G0056 [Candidatus Daviesbacteria bacterium GW2011_GWA2_38_24]KKQ80987.1 MAG: hypothetical protein UT01_C0002G0014 [Candidatus Daviesbacteria bacterium GW2011_GWA1_38_7]OGE24414.1 MAG: hypothetical protein A2688_04685 [Candidatus Daviesbacteria bacterium RIFCSPHIGHO2_01_FULL_38_8]
MAARLEIVRNDVQLPDLDTFDHCPLCLTPRGCTKNHVNQLTVDHVVLQCMRKKEPKAFRSIVESRDNQFVVCRREHAGLDKMKIFMYREHGVVGLVEQVALYPRAKRPDDLDSQYHQWMALFNRVRRGLYVALDHVSEEKHSQYRRGIDMTDRYLYRWAKGDFKV